MTVEHIEPTSPAQPMRLLDGLAALAWLLGLTGLVATATSVALAGTAPAHLGIGSLVFVAIGFVLTVYLGTVKP